MGELGEKNERVDGTARPLPRMDTWLDDAVADGSSQDWNLGGESTDRDPAMSVEGDLVFGDNEVDFEPRIESGHSSGDVVGFRGRETADLVYARSLRRGRVGKLLFALILTGMLGGFGWWYLQMEPLRVPAFEKEPNDTASEANPLRLGQKVSGYIGRRTERSRTDQDVYLIPLPADVKAVQVSLSGVPEVDLVVEVYTDRAVRLVKENQFGKAEGEQFTLKDIKAERLQIVVRGLWIPGVAPVENSTDPYNLLVSPVTSARSVSDEAGKEPVGTTGQRGGQNRSNQGEK